MKLTPYFRAECLACGIFKFLKADSAAFAASMLADRGWTDVCKRCTQVKELSK